MKKRIKRILIALGLIVAGIAVLHTYAMRGFSFVYLGPLGLNTPFLTTYRIDREGKYNIILKAYYDGRDTDTHDQPIMNFFQVKKIDDQEKVVLHEVASGEIGSYYKLKIEKPTTLEFSGSIKSYCSDCEEREGQKKIKEVYIYIEPVHQ